MDNLIEFRNVTKTYGNKVALNSIDLNISKGKIIGLLGPNGSGKTTLIKTVMRIIRHQQGTIKICGNVANYETRKFISFMPDREFLYDTMTVNDAINYYEDLFNDFDKNKANDLCQKLGLDLNESIKSLSKGTKEKVILMLTLSRIVPIYLLDEPLGNLDPLIKNQMLSALKEASNENNTIIISTHLIKDTAPIIDAAIFINKGNIIKNFDLKDIDKDLETYYLEVFSNGQVY